MSQVEDIKAKLDIVEVIREYVNVKAVGANFQALCPFHNEKTPSFVISPEKQIWHCFGCGRGGDVIAFVMEKEGLNFMEALRLLAPKAGIVLKHENPEAYSQRNRLLDILELTGKYYHHLLTTPTGKIAKEYLKQRGLDDQTLENWQLGYSPDSWDSLYKFLKARPLSGAKYTDEEIFLAGLITKKEGGSRGYYDRFRDRIMFPIWDANNNLIAFSARINPNKEKMEKIGKYINSPQTKVYDKSRVLFGLNKAKQAIKQADLAIVVEGQMDVISCHRHGYHNVVASSGTALTTEQVSLIKRFTPNLALCFDMDDAGQMAADRGIKEALSQEMNLKIIILPGKDPDECLRNNPQDFQQALAEAKPMLEYYFNKVTAGLDLTELANKQLVTKKMLTMISLVHNKLERDFWLKKLSEAVEVKEDLLRENLPQESFSTSQDSRPEKPAIIAISREDRLAELLLALLTRFSDLINYVISNLEPDYILNDELSRFYKNLIIYYNKAASLDYENFRFYLEEQGEESEKLLDKLVLLAEKDFYDFDNNQAKREIIKILVDLKKYGCQRKIKKLEKLIAQAEKSQEKEELVVLMDELKSLTDQLKEINLN